MKSRFSNRQHERVLYTYTCHSGYVYEIYEDSDWERVCEMRKEQNLEPISKEDVAD